MNARLDYQCACNGLVQAVKDAADPRLNEWVAYKGSRIAEAVLFSKLVMRMAIKFGLYDPDLYCLTHGQPLLDGPYGYRAGNCEDCEGPEVDGEAFRGGEAAAYERELCEKWQRLR